MVTRRQPPEPTPGDREQLVAAALAAFWKVNSCSRARLPTRDPKTDKARYIYDGPVKITADQPDAYGAWSWAQAWASRDAEGFTAAVHAAFNTHSPETAEVLRTAAGDEV